jgi:sigma-B regulation protein RsbU (phosphoserine phosphatase)
LAGAYAEPTQYCTVALASVDSRESGRARLTMALGGHPPALLVRRGGIIQRVGLLGPVVGWRAGVSYGESTVEMDSGDVLLLFTDGLTEALAGKGSTNDEPLCRLLTTMAGSAPNAVAEAIDSQIGVGQLTDDAAYLVVRRP